MELFGQPAHFTFFVLAHMWSPARLLSDMAMEPYPLSRLEWPFLRDIARRARWLTKYRLVPKVGTAGLWMMALNIEGSLRAGARGTCN